MLGGLSSITSVLLFRHDDGDERKTIDVLMTQLRSLVEETGIGLILVSLTETGR